MTPRVLTSPFWPRPFQIHRHYGPHLSRAARSRFYLESVELLRLELAQLGASRITLGTGHRRIVLGDDGWPDDSLSNAITSHPGVQLAFYCEYGWMHFLCDAFEQWEINFRSIGEALQGLGGVNLLGMVEEGRVYAPFRVVQDPFSGDAKAKTTKKPSTPPEPPIPSSVPDAVVIAATWLAARSSVSLAALLQTPDGLKRAYREAARQLHPDVEGGDHDSFVQLGRYFAVVETYRRSQS